ncbi:MAG: 2-amino-4-hydroxy-6-hydroxymethyldihydropteridine diphosphokinase [Mariprofundaceae bacterium]|nr:2-amino-4-hydroxy-6-hydroxymethyldihydropteridine diphosphokinase [Mariprofundaceae bacterium]
MTTALIGMGSNIHPEQYLLYASKEMRQFFLHVRYSQVYQSAAIGMDGDDFLNACCLLFDVPEQSQLLQWLKNLENKYDRDRSKGSWKPRTLDLDLLMYGDKVMDDDLFRYAHIFVPASELVDLDLPIAKAGILTQVPLRL